MNRTEAQQQLRELAHAMRVGAALRPQAREFYFEGDVEIASCALGAVYEGITNEITHQPGYVIATIRETFPVLSLSISQLRSLFQEISWRNDAGMTREAIANWLEHEAINALRVEDPR